MSWLLGLVPLKDKIYAVLIVALLAAGVSEYYHFKHSIAAAQHAADIAAEVAAVDAAQRQRAQDDADYAAKLKTIQGDQNVALQEASNLADSLNARLRAYANRNTCPVLQGSAPAPAAGTSGPSSVELAIEGLARAAAHDNAVIEAERAERDALTGK